MATVPLTHSPPFRGFRAASAVLCFGGARRPRGGHGASDPRLTLQPPRRGKDRAGYITGASPCSVRSFVVTDDPFNDLAEALRARVDRLVNLAEAKFQYILDTQGNPIRDLEDTKSLTLVVNAHGKLFSELIVAVGMLGRVAEQSLRTQSVLLDMVRGLQSEVKATGTTLATLDASLQGLDSALVALADEIEERTLVVPETPGDL